MKGSGKDQISEQDGDLEEEKKGLGILNGQEYLRILMRIYIATSSSHPLCLRPTDIKGHNLSVL